MNGEAAPPQAASITDLLDWDELARLLEPVTLELVAASFPGWECGQHGGWLWAKRVVPVVIHYPQSPLRQSVTAKTPVGLLEQLSTQEHLHADQAAAVSLAAAIEGLPR